MAERLRFTGDWPPQHLLADYPNWENALDEEGLDGQDETTIRPADDQSQIDEFVPFTAADVWLADGRQCVGMIELIDSVVGLNVFLDNEWYRLIRSLDQFNQLHEWQPYVENWLPENERSPYLKMVDTTVFPLRLASRLPYGATSSHIELKILASGSEESGE